MQRVGVVDNVTMSYVGEYILWILGVLLGLPLLALALGCGLYVIVLFGAVVLQGLASACKTVGAVAFELYEGETEKEYQRRTQGRKATWLIVRQAQVGAAVIGVGLVVMLYVRWPGWVVGAGFAAWLVSGWIEERKKKASERSKKVV